VRTRLLPLEIHRRGARFREILPAIEVDALFVVQVLLVLLKLGHDEAVGDVHKLGAVFSGEPQLCERIHSEPVVHGAVGRVPRQLESEKTGRVPPEAKRAAHGIPIRSMR
jgi:hypothetical protein